MTRITDDERPIVWISWSDGNAFIKVGQQGVTKIEAYEEAGQMGWVPWLKVYAGDVVTQRIDAAGKEIGYV